MLSETPLPQDLSRFSHVTRLEVVARFEPKAPCYPQPGCHKIWAVPLVLPEQRLPQDLGRIVTVTSLNDAVRFGPDADCYPSEGCHKIWADHPMLSEMAVPTKKKYGAINPIFKKEGIKQ